MIQGKPLAMTEVARDPSHFKRRGRMKKLLSFVAKALGLFSRISELSWTPIILILFFTIFIMIFIGIMKR